MNGDLIWCHLYFYGNLHFGKGHYVAEAAQIFDEPQHLRFHMSKHRARFHLKGVLEDEER